VSAQLFFDRNNDMIRWYCWKVGTIAVKKRRKSPVNVFSLIVPVTVELIKKTRHAHERRRGKKRAMVRTRSRPLGARRRPPICGHRVVYRARDRETGPAVSRFFSAFVQRKTRCSCCSEENSARRASRPRRRPRAKTNSRCHSYRRSLFVDRPRDRYRSCWRPLF